MGLKKTSVQNAMSLSLFMVNLSSYLLGSLRTHVAGAGISAMKSWYRGPHYASALLKMLPQNPEAIICEQIVEQICRLGLIHLPPERAPGQKMAA
jgi:putative transposase